LSITPAAYLVSKTILWLFFRLGYGLEVFGAERVPKRGGVVVACNHLSYLDPPLLGTVCPRRLHFMARADLFQHWLLGTYLRAVGVLPLQRGEGDVAALRGAVDRLHRGEAIAIFPEGGRQFSGVVGAARRGVGLLAATAHVPIVPALVQGTFQALTPGTSRLRRSKIRVAFGAPIPYTTNSVLDVGPQTRAASRLHHEALAAAVTRQWHDLSAQLHG
jgi:1-acyl-sn-glycerol-3-phosphate acyltransferase